MRKPTRKSGDLRTVKTFWRENMRFKGLFIVSCTAWLVGMIFQKLGVTFVAARATDRLIEASRATNVDYFSTFWPYVVGVAVVGLLGLWGTNISLYYLTRLETLVRPRLRMKIFRHLTNQSLKFHANTFSGSLVSQASRYVNAYFVVTDNFVINALRLFTNMVVSTVVIAFFSLPIALFMALWAVAFVALNLVLTKKRSYLSKEASAAESVVTGHLADATGNIGVIKSFAGEDYENKKHLDLAEDQASKKYVAWIRSIQYDMIYGTLMVFLQTGVMALAIRGIQSKSLSIGTLLLIQVYVVQLMNELWSLSGITRTVEQNLSDASEMTEILETAIDITDPNGSEPVRIKQGRIDFNHVDFTHAEDKDEESLFKDFDLHIKPGEKVGLVGHSGSGKTTLTCLILRFNDIDAGSITIDGQDIRAITQGDLRRSIAYVPQEPLLFHRSLEENIAYGKPHANFAAIKQAAHNARADEFIDQLPKAYDTLVGERGVKLSGGQRQRVAIARAMLKDAPILLLDEATSALDSESEVLIQEALWKLMEGRTAIVIAHRLSTIQRMDRIIVMDNGAITEQGTHKQLLANKGTYATLWKHQSGGFLED